MMTLNSSGAFAPGVDVVQAHADASHVAGVTRILRTGLTPSPDKPDAPPEGMKTISSALPCARA